MKKTNHTHMKKMFSQKFGPSGHSNPVNIFGDHVLPAPMGGGVFL